MNEISTTILVGKDRYVIRYDRGAGKVTLFRDGALVARATWDGDAKLVFEPPSPDASLCGQILVWLVEQKKRQP